MKRKKLALAALGLAACLPLWITWTGMRTDLQPADCIIVPGARVMPDGTPGVSFQARIERAVALYKSGLAPMLVFTGGQGESGPIESETGRSVAMRMGVPAEAILVETQSHDTWQNFYYARQVMREHQLKSCLIATDPFHSERCCLIARDLGLVPHPAPTFDGPSWRRTGSWLFYTGRECLSMAHYWALRQTGRRPREYAQD